MKQTGSKDLKFIPRKTNPSDTMDFPFLIVGHTLRWVSARASEDKFTRPWKILRKGDLPSNVIEELDRRSMNIFRDGETVRFGDLVLAFASEEASKEARKQVQTESNAQLKSIGIDSSKRPGIKHDARETSVERMGSSEFEK